MFGSSNLYNPSYSGTNKGTLYTGNSGMSSTPGIIKKSYMEVQPQLNINGKDEKVYVSNEGIYYYKDGDKYIALSDSLISPSSGSLGSQYLNGIISSTGAILSTYLGTMISESVAPHPESPTQKSVINWAFSGSVSTEFSNCNSIL